MRTAVVVGNPKPASRTRAAARVVVEAVCRRPADVEVDLVELARELVRFPSDAVSAVVERVTGCDLVVVASPTYKGTFTGLLKLFLDRLLAGSLTGVAAVPLMLGGDLRHALASEVSLKPVLAELGASCPAPGLFMLESEAPAFGSVEQWAAHPALAGLAAG